VEFAGGDKEKEGCKALDSDEMEAYKGALHDLVRAVSIAHFLGLSTSDF